jgi:flagellar basal-body rod protein FlgB
MWCGSPAARGLPSRATPNGRRLRDAARRLHLLPPPEPSDETDVMIDGVINAGAIPVLERVIQFSAARHRIIAHNVANIDTPRFRPLDVSVDDFQQRLAEAIETRRESRNGAGPLEIESTDEIAFTENSVALDPEPVGDNILFHDGNDRDPERLMQSLVENFMAFRTAADLLRSRFELMNTAIRERI